VKPREEWHVLLLDAHPGYISWEEYERNQERLRDNALAYGSDRRHGPPREGPALLQGLALCGICGTRMSVRYHHRGERLVPVYTCQVRTFDRQEPACQRIPGAPIDTAVGELLIELVTPKALELGLAVQIDSWRIPWRRSGTTSGATSSPSVTSMSGDVRRISVDSTGGNASGSWR
jgi:hypothetical protein